MTNIATTRRPVLITVLVVLIVLSGIGCALTAWITFATAGSTAIWAGIVQLVLAVAYFAVAKGLFDGNPTARFVAAAVAAVQIVLTLVLDISVASAIGGPGTVRTGSLVFPVLALIVLFTPKANAFFGPRR